MSGSSIFSGSKKVNRRQFLEKSAIGLTGISAGAAYSPKLAFNLRGKDLTGKSLPNIVIFLADDTGWKDVGYHGSEINTPNIDKLVKNGVELNHFYVYPVCSPTRASLLTGRPPSRYGISTPIAGRSKQALPKDTITLAEVLRRRGYETAITGKWHLGLRPDVGPRQYGFDRSYGYFHGQIDQFIHRYKNGDRTWHRDDEYIEEVGHVTDLITREAIRFIKELRNKTKPFFLYVPFSVPHYPLQEFDKWINPYLGKIKSRSRWLFAASMTHMDYAIGRILAAIREENLAEDTLAMFFSDNGGAIIPEGKEISFKSIYDGNYGPYDCFADNGPLRGGKGDLYEGGIRVPAVISWPGHLEPRRVDEPIVVYDMLPTLARLAGITLPSEMKVEGLDAWPAITGGSLPRERVMYWRSTRQLALRKGEWKLVHNGVSLDKGTDELFNIAEDPYEKRNLVAKNRGKLAELRKELAEQLAMDSKAK